MSSLRDIARKAIAASELEQPLEQAVEQAERCANVFQMPNRCSKRLEQDSSQISADNQGCSTVPRPREWNAGTLPAAIVEGIEELRRMPSPGSANRAAWDCVVRDSRRLADDGWAAQALKLGWTELDLFGGSLDRDADPYCDGLAAWLAGRKLLALDRQRAVAGDAKGNRWYFNRPRAEGARLLWAIDG